MKNILYSSISILVLASSANTTIMPLDDPLPESKPKQAAAVYVPPSGNVSAFVGTYYLEDEFFAAQNAERARLNKPLLICDIVICADGTFKRINGTTAVYSEITGTIQYTNGVVTLYAFKVNGEIAITAADKAVFRLKLINGGNGLATEAKVNGRSKNLYFRLKVD